MLISALKLSPSCSIYTFYIMRFAIFLSFLVFYFVIHAQVSLHNNSEDRGDDHDNVLRVLLFFFIWCHFVYLECF